MHLSILKGKSLLERTTSWKFFYTYIISNKHLTSIFITSYVLANERQENLRTLSSQADYCNNFFL